MKERTKLKRKASKERGKSVVQDEAKAEGEKQVMEELKKGERGRESIDSKRRRRMKERSAHH